MRSSLGVFPLLTVPARGLLVIFPYNNTGTEGLSLVKMNRKDAEDGQVLPHPPSSQNYKQIRWISPLTHPVAQAIANGVKF